MEHSSVSVISMVRSASRAITSEANAVVNQISLVARVPTAAPVTTATLTAEVSFPSFLCFLTHHSTAVFLYVSKLKLDGIRIWHENI